MLASKVANPTLIYADGSYMFPSMIWTSSLSKSRWTRFCFWRASLTSCPQGIIFRACSAEFFFLISADAKWLLALGGGVTIGVQNSSTLPSSPNSAPDLHPMNYLHSPSICRFHNHCPGLSPRLIAISILWPILPLPSCILSLKCWFSFLGQMLVFGWECIES